MAKKSKKLVESSGPSLENAMKASAGTITRGQAVFATGYDSAEDVYLVELAKADSVTTMPCVGIALDDFSNSEPGAILVDGRMKDFDTSSWSVGDSLYISSTVAGGFVKAEPSVEFIEKVATVIRSNATTGVIQVHNVGIAIRNATSLWSVPIATNDPTNGQILKYNSTSGKWEPADPGSGSGESNTASNVGTAGVGIFKEKVSLDLRFKKVNAGSSKVTITDDTDNSEVDFDIVEANISHTNIADKGSNTHSQIDTHLGASAPHGGHAATSHTHTESQITDLDHTDSTAIHDNVSSEISAITEKGTPVSADLVLIEDSAASNAKKRVQVGNLPGSPPYSNEVTGTSELTTTSSSDVLVTSMTITPAAGTYMVTFSAEVSQSAKGKDAIVSVYSAGARVNSSQRSFTAGGIGYFGDVSCVARVTVNGSQAIEAKFKCDSGTAKIYARSLSIIKVS